MRVTSSSSRYSDSGSSQVTHGRKEYRNPGIRPPRSRFPEICSTFPSSTRRRRPVRRARLFALLLPPLPLAYLLQPLQHLSFLVIHRALITVFILGLYLLIAGRRARAAALGMALRSPRCRRATSSIALAKATLARARAPFALLISALSRLIRFPVICAPSSHVRPASATRRRVVVPRAATHLFFSRKDRPPSAAGRGLSQLA